MLYVQDTAEVYGDGKSEVFVGEFVKRYPAEMAGFEKIVVATKYFPNFDRFAYPRSLVDAAEASIKRLGITGPIDLYYVSAHMLSDRTSHYSLLPQPLSLCFLSAHLLKPSLVTLQIHGPIGWATIETLASALGEAHKRGEE